MTELVQSTRAAEDSERSDVSGAQPAPMAVPHRLGWRGVWWFACGVAGTLAIVWFIIFSRGEIGSKAEWFFGAVIIWSTFFLTLPHLVGTKSNAKVFRLNILRVSFSLGQAIRKKVNLGRSS